MTGISEEQQQVILEFIFESIETLDSLEPTLIRLAEISSSEEVKETMNLVFRPFHSLKGGAGFLQLETIGRVTHTTENLLQLFRAYPTKWQKDYIDILMKSSDLLRKLLQRVAIEFNDQGFEKEADDLITELESYQKQLTSAEEETPTEEYQGLPKIEGTPPLTLLDALSKSSNLIHKLVQSNWLELEIQEDYKETVHLIHELRRHHTEIACQEGKTPGDLFYLPDSESHSQTKSSAQTALSTQTADSTNQPDIRLNSFINTTLEHLDTIEGVMLVLEKIPGDVDINEYVQTALGCYHTIKGNAGFLGLIPIERLSHLAENILSEILDDNLKIEDQNVQTLLQSVDTLRDAVSALSEGGTLDFDLFKEMEKKLLSLIPEKSSSLLGDVLVKMDGIKPKDISAGIEQQKSPMENILAKMGNVSQTDLEKSLHQKNVEKKKTSKIQQIHPTVTKMQDIRVSLNKLDQLFDLVGELIISESMIIRHPALKENELESLKNVCGQLHRNMRNLQEIVMSIRMVPLSSLFRKMVRVVHDASKKLNKQTKLELVGEKTEVDKTLVELITDPILHIIRNSMDHGIESEQDRTAAGKSVEGKIQLEAGHVGNEVWINIRDDGKGMNREVILNRALEKGLITDETQFLSDSEVWNLIFEPGFSTAKTVTDFSGRGVGMDVVKRNIEKLHGSVEVSSEERVGSTVTLKIPLTLSIIDGLLVRVGETSYALPTTTIRETLRPKEERIIKTMDGSEMLRIRRKLLPVMRLHKIHATQPEHQDLKDGMLLIVDQNDQLFCLFVDAVLGQQQIVVKSLPETMVEAPHLSGCTILGDGQVGLILDAASLAKAASVQKRMVEMRS